MSNRERESGYLFLDQHPVPGTRLLSTNLFFGGVGFGLIGLDEINVAPTTDVGPETCLAWINHVVIHMCLLPRP